jgi:hypothetical protein
MERGQTYVTLYDLIFGGIHPNPPQIKGPKRS